MIRKRFMYKRGVAFKDVSIAVLFSAAADSTTFLTRPKLLAPMTNLFYKKHSEKIPNTLFRTPVI